MRIGRSRKVKHLYNATSGLENGDGKPELLNLMPIFMAWPGDPSLQGSLTCQNLTVLVAFTIDLFQGFGHWLGRWAGKVTSCPWRIASCAISPSVKLTFLELPKSRCFEVKHRLFPNQNKDWRKSWFCTCDLIWKQGSYRLSIKDAIPGFNPNPI